MNSSVNKVVLKPSEFQGRKWMVGKQKRHQRHHDISWSSPLSSFWWCRMSPEFTNWIQSQILWALRLIALLFSKDASLSWWKMLGRVHTKSSRCSTYSFKFSNPISWDTLGLESGRYPNKLLQRINVSHPVALAEKERYFFTPRLQRVGTVLRQHCARSSTWQIVNRNYVFSNQLDKPWPGHGIFQNPLDLFLAISQECFLRDLFNHKKKVGHIAMFLSWFWPKIRQTPGAQMIGSEMVPFYLVFK